MNKRNVIEYGEDSYSQIKEVLGAKDVPDSTIRTALAYCQAANLDIMKKPIAIISFKNKDGQLKHEIVFTIQAITTIAVRAGWAGSDPIEYGPFCKFFGVEAPEWAQQTVYKVIGKTRCPFAGPKIYFKERVKLYNGQASGNWRSQPITMLNKCTTAAALRLAFPEELAHVYEEVEMEHGNTINVDTSGVERLEVELKPESIAVNTKPPVPPLSIESVEPSELQYVLTGIEMCNSIQDLYDFRKTLLETTDFKEEEKQIIKEALNKQKKNIELKGNNNNE